MTAQMIVGLVVLVAVAIGSIFAASDSKGNIFWMSIRNFLGTYVALTTVCAFIWVVAWVGMFLRSIVIWLMEAVFQPVIGLFQLFF